MGSQFYISALDHQHLQLVRIDGHALPYITEAKGFGVTFTPTLNWQAHVQGVSRRVFSPVYHHLDKTRVKNLDTALNTCVRFVLGNLTRRSHVTPPRMDLGWLSVCGRREYFICIQAFAVVANAHPSYLIESFICRQCTDLTVRRSERNPPQAFVSSLRGLIL